MSVTTKADEHIASAKEHIIAAYQDLLIVINPSTEGHNDYRNGYIEEIIEFLPQLMKLQKKL